ncbi:cupin domain-containing protein [Luteimonas salinisoli]|uniref:cupin domain-containing protein n=1 Tax=Luteimonas salinisoli TaxID=2752307 RepID=UPI0031F2F7EB
MASAVDTAELIRSLGLQPHPEGGHYRRVYTSAAGAGDPQGGRPALSAIRYLLAAGQRSLWHRIDAEEVWHWHGGDALELLRFDPAGAGLLRQRLGAGAGMRRVAVVPAGIWQAARPLGRYALALCTVSPGFAWAGFELAGEGHPVSGELRRLDAFH